MSHLSPQTLTHGEQRAILRATVRNSRDHLIYSLALGTGLRSEIELNPQLEPAAEPTLGIQLKGARDRT